MRSLVLLGLASLLLFNIAKSAKVCTAIITCRDVPESSVNSMEGTGISFIDEEEEGELELDDEQLECDDGELEFDDDARIEYEEGPEAYFEDSIDYDDADEFFEVAEEIPVRKLQHQRFSKYFRKSQPKLVAPSAPLTHPVIQIAFKNPSVQTSARTATAGPAVAPSTYQRETIYYNEPDLAEEYEQPAVCYEEPVVQSVVTCPKSVCPKAVCPKAVCPKAVCPKPVCPTPVCPKPVCPKPVCPKPVCPKPVCPKPVCPTPVCPKVSCPKPVCPKVSCPKPSCPKLSCPKLSCPKQTCQARIIAEPKITKTISVPRIRRLITSTPSCGVAGRKLILSSASSRARAKSSSAEHCHNCQCSSCSC